MNLEDVELSGSKVTIREGKGRKLRDVFIGPTTIKAIRMYLRRRPDRQSPVLFVSKAMERLTYDGLRQLIQRRSKKAGLSKEPTLHGFRRAFGLHMTRNGTGLFALQRLMGHSDPESTRRYVALTTEDLRSAHEKCSPVENYSWSRARETPQRSQMPATGEWAPQKR